MSHARREEAAKNRRTPDPEHLTIARRAAARSPACLMTFGPQPPGEVKANAHSLIRLRERTENPQLTDVPSDLRVNGARHASRYLALPSKPMSPPRLRSVTKERRRGVPVDSAPDALRRILYCTRSTVTPRMDSPSDDWTIPVIVPVWIPCARAVDEERPGLAQTARPISRFMSATPSRKYCRLRSIICRGHTGEAQPLQQFRATRLIIG
jgi:hypothetical protein